MRKSGKLKTIAKQTIAKRTIAERIAERMQVGQTQTLEVIQAFLDEVVDELAKGNRLEFREFGIFEAVVRKSRVGLNPKTLEKVPVPAKVIVKFKAGNTMRARAALLTAEAEAEGGQEATVITTETKTETG